MKDDERSMRIHDYPNCVVIMIILNINAESIFKNNNYLLLQ